MASVFPVKSYSTTPADNVTGFPENQNPSSVNDAARDMQAAVREVVDSLEWTDLGHVPVQQDSDTFKISSTVTAIYQVGRRLRLQDGPNTRYATVTAASVGSGTTDIDVVVDGAVALTASLSQVQVGIAVNQVSIGSGAFSAVTGLAHPVNLVITNNSGTPASQIDIDADEVMLDEIGRASCRERV